MTFCPFCAVALASSLIFRRRLCLYLYRMRARTRSSATIAATTAPAMTPAPTRGDAGGDTDEDEGEDVGDVEIGDELASASDGGTFSIRNDCMIRGI
jgi:hypothetical protein